MTNLRECKNISEMLEGNALLIRRISLKEIGNRSFFFEDWDFRYPWRVSEVNALRCRCYGAVYLELLRHAQQLTLNERHAPQIRPLMNVLRSAAERTQYEDDCFPRIALRIAKDRGDKELVEEVFSPFIYFMLYRITSGRVPLLAHFCAVGSRDVRDAVAVTFPFFFSCIPLPSTVCAGCQIQLLKFLTKDDIRLVSRCRLGGSWSC